ncbi:hypothetical protein [Effusibacillus lacus]|uniref:Uncharacterized protein n=1 Tax=Effusibacillus lacus TaxID=1348429 RepID=A0A292YRU0_9BACL|nr:hypothetical protein [Effusibacillus lacus]TCS76790.1 hypothetical protein EDD64_10110 [Effusibacillus lacus]GAX91124.1 hypothetical protein EFBL_2790 [Effusibacillus lacus]
MKKAVLKFISETVMVALVSSLVILSNAMVGWVMILNLFSFYLAVFFFLFSPAWLVAFGIVFQPKWKWYSMSAGSFLTVFLLCTTFFLPAEDWQFRLLNALVLSILGTGLVLAGWIIRKLANSIKQDLLQKERKRRSEEQATSLGA